jgi:Sigma-70, region 4
LRKRSELMQSLGRYPTQAELALKMNMNVKTVNYILNVAKPIKSIYEDVKGVDNLTVGDTIPDNRIDFENTIAAADERACVRAVVEELPEAEKEIIKLSYFEGLPYSVIAQQINKSVERVRQLKQRGLRQLRHPRMSKRLLDEDIDRRTLFYSHRGVSKFNTTWTSSTEQTVLQREYLKKRLENSKSGG